MATANNVQAWSSTPASNASADSTISSSDSQSPDTLDNDIRNIMAAVRNFAKDTGGALVAGGTSTALTITTNQAISSGHIANGYTLVIRTASASTGAATIAVDSLTAVDLKKQGGAAIASGDWASGDILILVYSSTATAFIAANISVAAQTPAVTASFRVSKSANQTVSTSAETTVTFDTEAFDVGSHFTSNAWTPPSGTCRLYARLAISAYTDPYIIIRIKKDGSEAARATVLTTGVNGDTTSVDISFLDQCNGSNAYTVTIDATSDSNYTVVGGQTYLSTFQGSMI